MRLRAASGEDGTRGFGFLWGLLRCWGGDCFILAAALCPAKRRFAFSPMGSHARLAAEIPDIFLPLARNDVRNDDGGMPPCKKKRVGRGIKPKTDARSSLHNHPDPARLLLRFHRRRSHFAALGLQPAKC